MLKTNDYSRLFNTLAFVNTPMTDKCNPLTNLKHIVYKFFTAVAHKPIQWLVLIFQIKTNPYFISGSCHQMLLGYFLSSITSQTWFFLLYSTTCRWSFLSGAFSLGRGFIIISPVSTCTWKSVNVWMSWVHSHSRLNHLLCLLQIDDPMLVKDP